MAKRKLASIIDDEALATTNGNAHPRQYSDREILQRLRAEFDFLFDRIRHRGDYQIKLEACIMNRLQEAKLTRYQCGDRGIFGFERQKEIENLKM